jgi:hypothetical protein
MEGATEMNETNLGHHGNEGPDPGSVHHHVDQGKRPYWRTAHRDWRVWVGLFFMLLAITIYVLTENLSFVPHFGTHPKPLARTGGSSS